MNSNTLILVLVILIFLVVAGVINFR